MFVWCMVQSTWTADRGFPSLIQLCRKREPRPRVRASFLAVWFEKLHPAPCSESAPPSPQLGPMLYCYQLAILNNCLTGGLLFWSYTGPHQWHHPSCQEWLKPKKMPSQGRGKERDSSSAVSMASRSKALVALIVENMQPAGPRLSNSSPGMTPERSLGSHHLSLGSTSETPWPPDSDSFKCHSGQLPQPSPIQTLPR